MASLKGKIITALGPREPSEIGKVMMHEHLHLDCYDMEKQEVIDEEKPVSRERHDFLMEEAVPYLKKCGSHGCHAFVDATPPPFRAWPTIYPEISKKADIHIILSTGFYREIELGTFWVKRPEDSIWQYAAGASEEELTELFINEVVEGIHGTDVRAGAIKICSSRKDMTDTEKKGFRAGAGAQKATGVSLTTHCTKIGAETTQLQLLDDLGVDLSRVIIGHTAAHLMDPGCRSLCIDWMKRGASFLPTNLDVEENPEKWQPLINAIHEIFDAGLGEKLLFGMDWSYCSGPGQSPGGKFGPCTYLPEPPFIYLFTKTLPAFRSLGLTEEEEETIMKKNPQGILPVI